VPGRRNPPFRLRSKECRRSPPPRRELCPFRRRQPVLLVALLVPAQGFQQRTGRRGLHLEPAVHPTDESSYGKARSQPEWIEHIQRSTRVFRVDYATDDGKYWGTFDLGDLAEEAGIPVDDLQRQLEVSFEINSELDITLCFRRQKAAYRRFPAHVQSIELGPELARTAETGGEGGPDGGQAETPQWNSGKELSWDIAVQRHRRGASHPVPRRDAVRPDSSGR